MTKFRGVTAHKDSGFVANIGHQGGKIYLGWFREFEQAKAARLQAEVRYFGAVFDRREIEFDVEVARIPLHGQRGVFKGWALIDASDLELVRGVAWTIDPRGYVAGRPPGAKSAVTLHRVLMPGAVCVDHINRDKLDNRRQNLRACSLSENSRNSGISINNTSGFKGVTPTPKGRWRARIWMDRKEIHIGTYDTPEAAQKAYDAKALELHGRFASPNIEIKELGAQ